MAGGLATCAGPEKSTRPAAVAPSLAEQEQAAQSALQALREARFEATAAEARSVLARDTKNPYVHLAAAIAGYRDMAHQLWSDLLTVASGVAGALLVNHRYLRAALEQAAKDLATIDEHLQAASVPQLTLDLCLACWEVDWNRNGEVDERDRLLLAVEQDVDGNRIDEDDPRHRPVFRFDYGDVLWARAFISFQRAALDLVLSYNLTAVDGQLLQMLIRAQRIQIPLQDVARIGRARAQLLTGLKLAGQARLAYLAETDDHREWLPNPRQKDHPLPLPVDEALYATWGAIIGDLERILRGKEGLSVAELAQLGDHHWEDPPRGFLDLGGMLAHPRDLVFDLAALELDRDLKERPERFLQGLLGDYYRPRMKASPLVRRLKRMKQEAEQGKESLERKLRYLLWLN